MSVRDTTGARRPSGYFFLTPVWGESYTRLYIDTVIPSQLASGNLPIFRGSSNCQYIIYTTPRDAQLIRSSAVYEKLAECVPVKFEWLEQDINVVHDMMTDCFRRGIKAAEENNAAFLLMTPDIVYAEGAFATLQRLSQSGHDVIFMTAIRTIKNTVASNLNASFKSDDVIKITPRQLVQVAFDNLHPLGHSSWWEEGDGGLIPANIYWRVPGDGLVAHCFHLHPILVYPQRLNANFFGTVDSDYIEVACPDSSGDYIVANSDDLFAIELSDPWRFFEMRFAKGSVTDTVRWAEQFTNGRHVKLFDTAIRIHTGIIHPELWDSVERRARTVVQEIEARLNWPIWKLLFDADLIPRRIVRRTKELRLRLANPNLADNKKNSVFRWRNALLIVWNKAIGVRSTLVEIMRALAALIETLAAYPYRSQLDKHLTALINPASNVVFIATSPGRSYLESWLSKHSKTFARGHYLSLARESGVAFLENGFDIASQSKNDVLLEVDIAKQADLAAYFRDSHALAGRPAGELPTCPAGFDKADSIARTFDIVSVYRQGGLGTWCRVKLENWARTLINRRLDLRGLLIAFCLPLLPLFVLLGGIVIVMTFLLDALDHTGKFSISTLTIARKRVD
jgi:hypothetical protein